MKLVSPLHGRVMQGFNADDVRGPQSTYLPTAVDLFMKRYAFLAAPDLQDSSENGIKFKSGRMKVDGSELAIESLDIYNDGVVVVCRTTSEAERVLDDVISWTLTAFGARKPKSLPPRLYTSWLIVDFDEPIAKLVAQFERLRSLIIGAHERAYGQNLDFQFQRISFNADPLKLPLHTFTEYAIDRRGAAAYELNRFFCTAPLTTDAHLELLQSFDRALVTQ